MSLIFSIAGKQLFINVFRNSVALTSNSSKTFQRLILFFHVKHCISFALSSKSTKDKIQPYNFQINCKVDKSNASVVRRRHWTSNLSMELLKSSRPLLFIQIMIACNGEAQENIQLSKDSKRTYSNIYCMRSVKKSIQSSWPQAFQPKKSLMVLGHTFTSVKMRNWATQ